MNVINVPVLEGDVPESVGAEQEELGSRVWKLMGCSGLVPLLRPTQIRGYGCSGTTSSSKTSKGHGAWKSTFWWRQRGIRLKADLRWFRGVVGFHWIWFPQCEAWFVLLCCFWWTFYDTVSFSVLCMFHSSLCPGRLRRILIRFTWALQRATRCVLSYLNQHELLHWLDPLQQDHTWLEGSTQVLMSRVRVSHCRGDRERG